jgi:integrase/recombinase XerD
LDSQADRNPEDQATPSAIEPVLPSPFDRITDLVVNSVHSEHSQRAYRRAIEGFIAWYQAQPGRPPLSKALVQQYRVALTGAKLAPSTINVQLSAIRKLAAEAADNRLLDADLAAGIAKVRGVKNAGVRAGNWLTRERARELLLAPDTSTLKGKGGRKRTVPVPAWVKNAIDAWTSAAEIKAGPIFRSIGKGGRLKDTTLAQVGVWWLVKEYAERIGIKNLAPHDLRRTCAKLCRKSGGDLEQIQMLLGHASIQTTEKYLGMQQNLVEAVNDKLGIVDAEEQ